MIEDVREIKIIEVQHTDGEKQITSYYLKDGTHLKDLEIVRPKMSFKIQPGSLKTNLDDAFTNIAELNLDKTNEKDDEFIQNALKNAEPTVIKDFKFVPDGYEGVETRVTPSKDKPDDRGNA